MQSKSCPRCGFKQTVLLGYDRQTKSRVMQCKHPVCRTKFQIPIIEPQTDKEKKNEAIN